MFSSLSDDCAEIYSFYDWLSRQQNVILRDISYHQFNVIPPPFLSSHPTPEDVIKKHLSFVRATPIHRHPHPSRPLSWTTDISPILLPLPPLCFSATPTKAAAASLFTLRLLPPHNIHPNRRDAERRRPQVQAESADSTRELPYSIPRIPLSGIDAQTTSSFAVSGTVAQHRGCDIRVFRARLHYRDQRQCDAMGAREARSLRLTHGSRDERSADRELGRWQRRSRGKR